VTSIPAASWAGVAVVVIAVPLQLALL